ncbi:glyoxalase [Nonomuraea sp. CA-141351]|uniref:glyoxalase n=1 Tax=Nonomuraea sp. CA-141351 TaxID=3239996 RepID=UPI003D92F531
MTTIHSVTFEVPDPTAADDFYATAFGVGAHVLTRASQPPTTGFRGYLMSLVVSQPSTVDSLFGTALQNGATSLKPPTKSFWGYGGVLRDPYGTLWKIASSSKKDTGPATRDIDDIVLLLGVEDVAVTKRFYVERGLSVTKSFGRKYVEFATAPVRLALYSRRAAAKDAGVSIEGTGSHRLIINADADPLVDPDGFTWEATSLSAR